jgi:hypothetical protein
MTERCRRCAALLCRQHHNGFDCSISFSVIISFFLPLLPGHKEDINPLITVLTILFLLKYILI